MLAVLQNDDRRVRITGAFCPILLVVRSLSFLQVIAHPIATDCIFCSGKRYSFSTKMPSTPWELSLANVISAGVERGAGGVTLGEGVVVMPS